MAKDGFKTCIACKREFPETLTHFYSAGRQQSGALRLMSRCKTCDKAKKRTAYVPGKAYIGKRMRAKARMRALNKLARIHREEWREIYRDALRKVWEEENNVGEAPNDILDALVSQPIEDDEDDN